MKYGPDRFNRNPRASEAATGDHGTGERLNYCAAGFCAPECCTAPIPFIFISLSVKRTTLGIVAVVFAPRCANQPSPPTPIPFADRFSRKKANRIRARAPYDPAACELWYRCVVGIYILCTLLPNDVKKLISCNALFMRIRFVL